MKAEELYELRIGGSLTQKALATYLGIDRRIAGRSKDRSSGAYVNLHEVPMTGTSVADSLIMRNLTRFLWLGIARVMGKNTSKRDYILSDVGLVALYFAAGCMLSLDSSSST